MKSYKNYWFTLKDTLLVVSSEKVDVNEIGGNYGANGGGNGGGGGRSGGKKGLSRTFDFKGL